ncbi:hypothetical protein [Futiania mangrovi]|uniref:Uncharacterized protein n=1 Tax=Futiania mangrovi TaxID=2959716 RepID=A0A9J6PAU4_9PROT|nr:hypothetical protein [Futiania mangrovii]MCP1336245.1 hypothetical protein [Futiania mangrovii]
MPDLAAVTVRAGAVPGGDNASHAAAQRLRARIARPAAGGPRMSVLLSLVLLCAGVALILPRTADSLPGASPAPSFGTTASGPGRDMAAAGPDTLAALARLAQPAADLLAGTGEPAVRPVRRGTVVTDLTRRVIPRLPAAPAFPEEFLPTPVIEARLAEAEAVLTAAEAAVFEARRTLGATRRMVADRPDAADRLRATQAAVAAGEGARVRAEAAWSVPAAQLEARRIEVEREFGARAEGGRRYP